jgi:hypothetical protein
MNLSQDSSRAHLASEQTVQKGTVHHSTSSAEADMFVTENKPTFWPNKASVAFLFLKKKNYVSFDFICIAFYVYNSVKFQDLLVVFVNSIYRKRTGSDVNCVLILKAGTSELRDLITRRRTEFVYYFICYAAF